MTIEWKNVNGVYENNCGMCCTCCQDDKHANCEKDCILIDNGDKINFDCDSCKHC